MLPHECDQLCSECCDDVKAQLAPRSRDGHQVVGAFAFPVSISADLIESAVRNTLDLLVKVAGPSMVNATLAYKAQIRQIVSQAALEQIDKIVHGLQDAKAG